MPLSDRLSQAIRRVANPQDEEPEDQLTAVLGGIKAREAEVRAPFAPPATPTPKPVDFTQLPPLPSGAPTLDEIQRLVDTPPRVALPTDPLLDQLESEGAITARDRPDIQPGVTAPTQRKLPELLKQRTDLTSRESAAVVGRTLRETKRNPNFLSPEEVARSSSEILNEDEATAFNAAQKAADIGLSDFDPINRNEERGLTLFETLNRSEIELQAMSPTQISELNNLIRDFIDDEGKVVFPERIQVYLDTLQEGQATIIRQTELQRIIFTTGMRDMLQSAYDSAVEEGGTIKLDAVLNSSVVKSLNDALVKLLAGDELDPFPIWSEEGVLEHVDPTTPEGFNDVLTYFEGQMVIAGSDTSKIAFGATNIYNWVDNLSTDGAPNPLSSDAPSDVFSLATFMSGTNFKHSDINDSLLALTWGIANNPLYDDSGIAVLFARRDEFVGRELQRGRLGAQAHNEEEIKRTFNAFERFAEDNDVSISEVLGWADWVLTNNVSIEAGQHIRTIQARMDINPGKGPLGEAFDFFLETPKILEYGALRTLSDINDITGLPIGTALAFGVQRALTLGGLTDIIPTIKNAIELDSDEIVDTWNPINRVQSLDNYLTEFGKLSESAQRHLVNSGFGVTWQSWENPNTVEKVARELAGGANEFEVVRDNFHSLNAISTLAGELIFDPFNGPFILAKGAAVPLRLGSWMARGTRFAGVTRRAVKASNVVDPVLQAAQRLDPLDFIGRGFANSFVKPFGSRVLRGDNIVTSVANSMFNSQLLRTTSLNGIRRFTMDLIANDVIVTPINAIGGSVRQFATSGGPAIEFARAFGGEINSITSSNAFLNATKRSISRRAANDALASLTDFMSRTARSSTEASRFGATVRSFPEVLNSLDNMWRDITGTFDEITTIPGLRAAMDANSVGAHAAMRALTGTSDALTENLYYLAELTRGINIRAADETRDVVRAMLNFDEVAEGLGKRSFAEKEVLWAEMKGDFLLGMSELLERRGYEVVGLPNKTLIERGLTAVSYPLTLMFLTTPRFIIRNTVGGHVLAGMYGGAPWLDEGGLFAPGNLTGKWARNVFEEHNLPDVTGSGILGDASPTGRATDTGGLSLAGKIKRYTDVRALDRRIDATVRRKVMAYQFNAMWNNQRRALVEGVEGGPPGLVHQLTDALGGNERLARQLADELLDANTELEGLEIAQRWIDALGTDPQAAGRLSPSQLDNTPWPDELRDDLYSDYAQRLRGIDQNNPAEIERVIDEAITSSKDRIAGIAAEADLTDVIPSEEALEQMARIYMDDIQLVKDVPSLTREQLQDWISTPNMNLFSKVQRWALDAREQDTINMILGSLPAGKERNLFISQIRRFQDELMPELEHIKYGMPGTSRDPNEFRKFMYVPEGEELPFNVPEELITRDPAEEVNTYFHWLRTDKFAKDSGRAVFGGGLANISADTAWRNYRGILDQAPIDEAGNPMAFGLQAERTKSNIAFHNNTYDNVRKGEYFEFAAEAESRYIAARNAAFQDMVLEPYRTLLQGQGWPIDQLPPRMASSSPISVDHAPPPFKHDRVAQAQVLDEQQGVIDELITTAREGQNAFLRNNNKLAEKPRALVKKMEKDLKRLLNTTEGREQYETSVNMNEQLHRDGGLDGMAGVTEPTAKIADELRRMGLYEGQREGIGGYVRQRLDDLPGIRPGVEQIVDTGNPADFVYRMIQTGDFGKLRATGLSDELSGLRTQAAAARPESDFWYHATPTRNMAGIRRNGLQPRDVEARVGITGQAGDGIPASNFFASTPEEAIAAVEPGLAPSQLLDEMSATLAARRGVGAPADVRAAPAIPLGETGVPEITVIRVPKETATVVDNTRRAGGVRGEQTIAVGDLEIFDPVARQATPINGEPTAGKLTMFESEESARFAARDLDDTMMVRVPNEGATFLDETAGTNGVRSMDEITPDQGQYFDEATQAWRTVTPQVNVDDTAFDLSQFLSGEASADRRLFTVPDVEGDTAKLRGQFVDGTAQRMVDLSGESGAVLTNAPEILSRLAKRLKPFPLSMTQRGPVALRRAREIWNEFIDVNPHVVGTADENAQMVSRVNDARNALLERGGEVSAHVEAQFQVVVGAVRPAQLTNVRMAQRWHGAFEEILTLFDDVQDTKDMRYFMDAIKKPSKSRMDAATIRPDNPLRGNRAVTLTDLETLKARGLDQGLGDAFAKAIDKAIDNLEDGKLLQDVLADLTRATNPDSIRALVKAMGFDAIAWTGRDRLGVVTEGVTVFDSAVLNRRLAEGGSLPPISRPLEADEMDNIQGILGEYQENLGRSRAAVLGSARAITDNVTHNAFVSNDFDFLARTMFPWEWWMIRTVGKGAIRLGERPRIAGNYLRLTEQMKQMNEDLPPYLQDRLQIPIPGWPSFLGVGPFLDPLSLIFQVQLDVYNDVDQSEFAGALRQFSGVTGLGVSPFITGILNATGLMGKRSKLTPFPTTGLEEWYNGVQNVLATSGISSPLPHRVRYTNRDRFGIERNVWRLVVEDTETDTQKYTRQEVQDAVDFLNEELPASNVIGSFLNTSLQRSDNKLLQDALNRFENEEMFTRNFSFLTGVLASSRSPLDAEFFEQTTELSEKFRKAILASRGFAGLDGDGGLAIRDFFKEHPEAELLWLKGDAGTELTKTLGVQRYWDQREAWFAEQRVGIDKLPAIGEENELTRRRLVEQMFATWLGEDKNGNGILEEGELGKEAQILEELGLERDMLFADKEFPTDAEGMELLITLQVFEITDNFEGKNEWLATLTDDERERVERIRASLTTNIGEYIAADLREAGQRTEELYTDNNGVVDFGAAFALRDGVLSAFPPEVKNLVEVAENQFKSPRELVVDTIKDFYILNWLHYINLGSGENREVRGALQNDFRRNFKSPSIDELWNKIQPIAPHVTKEEIRQAVLPEDFAEFELFLAQQDANKVNNLELEDRRFYAPSGEVVTQDNLTGYSDAVVEIEQYFEAKNDGIPIEWSQSLELWFGSGAEGVIVQQRKESIDEWFSELVGFASGKPNSRELGGFSFVINATDQAGNRLFTENTTINEAFDILRGLRDKWNTVRDGLFNPWAVSTPGGGQRELSFDELKNLADGRPLAGQDFGQVTRERSGTFETFEQVQAKQQETQDSEAAARLSALNSGNRTGTGTGRQLSKTDIMIAVENGRLPVAEGFERLLRLGYSEDDARLLMQEAESKLGDIAPRRFGAPAAPSAESFRARAREILGSDRVVDELLEVLQFGRSLSKQGERDLRLLARLYPLPEARTFEEWLAAIRVILTGDLQGLRIPTSRSPQGFRREIRRVRPLR